MDGLECSEIMLSSLERTLRIDAEFYKKGNLQVDALLSTWEKMSFTDCFQISDGNHMSISESFCDNGIPYYRGQDIYHLFIEQATPYRIDKRTFNKPQMHRSHLRKGDVLMSIVGAIIGNSALVTMDEDATCSCKLAIMRAKGTAILSETMLVYIKTKYGQVQIQKFKRGAAQTGLLLEDFDQLHIPTFSMDFQSKLRDLVQTTKAYQESADERYHDAEVILLSALNYQPIVQTQSYSEKSFSASFDKTGRLDAEYYQPKYDEVCASLHTSDTVHSLCVLHDQNFMPNGKQKYTYIELADVGQMGEISEIDPVYGVELPTRARRKVEAGQVIISSIEGSLQSCALITDEFNGALCSTGFYILTSESLNPETLLVLFKSEPIQALMKQRCSGTILTAISKDELLSMPLPKIDENIQELISEKVQKSFSLRRQSKQLLENAKHAVEMAIEQGEDKAMRWLQEQGEI